MPQRPIKLMLVDDHPIWRDSVRRVLERKKLAEVVAQASDGEGAVKLAASAKPEVILMDLHLPGLSGTEATARIIERRPETKVLMLSSSGDEEDVLSAVKAGARGYILKTGDPDEIIDAVRRVHKGEVVFTAALAGLVLGEFKRSGPAESRLSSRERTVLKLISEGLDDDEIAARFSMSVKNVREEIRTCVAKLQSKGGTPDRPERIVGTVLFVDIVGSTEMAARLGDERWSHVLSDYYALARRHLPRHGGREIGTAGDGVLAIFEQPTRAVTCAQKISFGVEKLGFKVRAGVHIGELELMGENIGGIAVHIGARISAKAKPGEVLVSSTVRELMVGTKAKFVDRGTHVLKGVPGRWRLFAAGG